MNVLKKIQSKHNQNAAASSLWSAERKPYTGDDPVQFWRQQNADASGSQVDETINLSEVDQAGSIMSTVGESSGGSYLAEAPSRYQSSEWPSASSSFASQYGAKSESSWRGLSREDSPSRAQYEGDSKEREVSDYASDPEEVESELESSTEIFKSPPTADEDKPAADRGRTGTGPLPSPKSFFDMAGSPSRSAQSSAGEGEESQDLSDSLKSQVMSYSTSVPSRLDETLEESMSIWPQRKEGDGVREDEESLPSNSIARQEWEESQEESRAKLSFANSPQDADHPYHAPLSPPYDKRTDIMEEDDAAQRESYSPAKFRYTRPPLSPVNRNLAPPSRPSSRRSDFESLKSEFFGPSSSNRDTAAYVYEQLKTPRDRWGRPKRNRLPPLEFWRNERVVYGHRKGELIPSLIGVIRNTSIPTPLRPSRRRRLPTPPIEAAMGDHGDTQYGTISAAPGEGGREEKRVVAIKTPTWKTISIGNPKALIADSFGGVTGWIKLLSGSRQEFGADPRQSKVFFVQKGQLSVQIDKKVIHVSSGGTVLVPPNYSFTLTNISKGYVPCILAFIAYPGDMLPSDEVLL
ncbi:uncharacterized protein LOC126322692 [Schistocerca gregaria]|uniref:uncharacterized protein LOC126322692 n=1 Tax=Schistocerca gregaria TaxID=7010 RepID=UPI00211EBEB0|nr:uncharacterized protein LOC126322692 [Schistocerca gregaria]